MTTTTPLLKPSDHTAELVAFVETLALTPSDAPTACRGWTAHELVAHLVAGAEEMADLVSLELAGSASRPTRSFASREAPWRRLPDAEMRDALFVEGARLIEALDALHDLDPERTVLFTGWRMTATQLATHTRSELVVHRWDLVGDDETGRSLAAQAELLVHAGAALHHMPTLAEARRSVRPDDDLLAAWGRRGR